MSNRKEKISLRNLSSANIAVLCWCGTILAGAIIRLVCNKVSFKNLPEDCVGFAVLFLIQLVVAIIIGKCYTETPSAIHRKILLILGVLHSTMREIANKFFLLLFASRYTHFYFYAPNGRLEQNHI